MSAIRKAKGRPSRSGAVRFNSQRRGKKFSASSKVGNVTLRDAASLAMKAWNATKYITSLINVEEKMFDFTQALTTQTYTGSVVNLSNVAEGSDYNNRDGNSILVQKLEIRGQVNSSTNNAGINAVPVIRILILRDMLQNAGADPTPADILETTGTALAPFSPFNHILDGQGNSSARRFRVLKDFTHQLVPPFGTTIATTTTGNLDALGSDSVSFDWRIPVGAHTMFKGTSGADASDYVGALYALMISNVQTNGPNVALYSRMYFTDN